nr:hypothetical protein GCM10025732_28360 [Glycomyces mayteni]
MRSTFGTSTELLNYLRLMYSRLGAHLCPNGHRQEPTIDVATGADLTCPVCGAVFTPPGAESFAFNSDGACPRCEGTGVVREVDEATLVPDPSKSIEDGAVAPWSMFGLTVMPAVAAELGVRTDVPYADLTAKERETVMRGPEVKRQIRVPSKSGKLFDLNFTYRNARRAVEEAVRNAASEKGLARVNRFISVQTCPVCGGTRLNERARSTTVDGRDLAEATATTLGELVVWVPEVVAALPADMARMGETITAQFLEIGKRLIGLGLDYLSLDRAGSTLSTGSGSACSSPGPCGTRPRACSTSSTSRPSASTPPTSTASSPSCATCSPTGTPWSWSTTTCRCSARPTGSSRSAPARDRKGARCSRPATPPRSPRTGARSSGRSSPDVSPPWSAPAPTTCSPWAGSRCPPGRSTPSTPSASTFRPDA